MKRITNRRIAVVGDVGLDVAYFYRTSDELSVETGLPVKYVRKYSFGPGAAANLAADIAMLGSSCDLYGFSGRDEFGSILDGCLSRFGVGNHLVRPANFSTFVYSKTFNENYDEESRFDIGNDNAYENSDIDTLLEDLRNNLDGYDALVINQQFENTIHSEYFQKMMSELLQYVDIPVWFDSRKDIVYPRVNYKINEIEAERLFHSSDIKGNLMKLYDRIRMNNASHCYAVITRGQNGVCAYDGKNLIMENGVFEVLKTDPVGAGDAFLAMLTVCDCDVEMSLEEKVRNANLAASISTRTLYGCGHPTWDQVEELEEDTDYRYNPELASDVRLAEYIDGTDIELINKGLHACSMPKVAIFDHDGTVSTMRQGWEKVMRQLMVESICGDKYDGLSAETIAGIQKSVDMMIEKTTGIQTILQMVQLVSMIREYGYVNESDIRTPLEYKTEYRMRLSNMIEHKYELFRKGIFTPEDLTMKSSLEFLKYLRSKGVTVYLASGSDYEDVKYEMDLFGYSELYSGGIFGSVGDVSKDPKKLVMSNIIRSIETSGRGIDPSEIVVFGDGPVEIREARKRGFIAVGVSSDEKQRFGINLTKRERLVLAGADFIIPDFSWMPILSEYLGWTK